MRLTQPFLKLPIRFDADAVAAEVRGLPPSAWTPHPTGYVGNEAVRLITPYGGDTDDIEGPMAATEHLQRCDYVREIMAEIGAVWGRSRFMGLAAGSEVPSHIDINYYWRTHLRIHIPVITNPGVGFTCDGETIHMAAGECWILDSFYPHSVANRGTDTRVHLVLDTVGSGRLWDLITAANGAATESPLIKPGATGPGSLDYEQVNAPVVMSPWEMKAHVAYLAEWTDDQPGLGELLAVLNLGAARRIRRRISRVRPPPRGSPRCHRCPARSKGHDAQRSGVARLGRAIHLQARNRACDHRENAGNIWAGLAAPTHGLNAK